MNLKDVESAEDLGKDAINTLNTTPRTKAE
jgi:hypothetical protein